MSQIEFLPKEKRLRVGLVGFGKTGRAVATVLLQDKTLDLVWVLRKSNSLEHRSVPEFLGIQSDEDGRIHRVGDVDFDTLQSETPVDVIVDFSSESGMDFYGARASSMGITIVSAISSLSKARVNKLKQFASSTRVLWSPNITLGINFLIIAAKTLQKIAPTADISILEEHFRTKPEVSGTALKIARFLELDPAEIKVVRAGGIIGVHEVLFGFPFQTVRLKHESISREAFGNGAKFAIKELSKREPGFYLMEDLVGRFFADANAHYASPESKVPSLTKSLFKKLSSTRIFKLFRKKL